MIRNLITEAVLGWLQDLWGAFTAQEDHGCNIDPDGKPRCSP